MMLQRFSNYDTLRLRAVVQPMTSLQQLRGISILEVAVKACTSPICEMLLSRQCPLSLQPFQRMQPGYTACSNQQERPGLSVSAFMSRMANGAFGPETNLESSCEGETRLKKCRRLYLTMRVALALYLPAKRFREECKAQERRVNVLMARLWHELLHAADIFCAPFCAGRLLDTLFGYLRSLWRDITA